MRNSCKSVLALWVIGIGLGAGAPAQAASGVGPYYATPAWDQTLPASTRFIVLTNMNSEAVLDRETGLVWEKTPSSLNLFTWNGAQAAFRCNNLNVGGRKGWKLPTIQELASLVDGDPANTNDPRLPPGHPFQILQSSVYWSATSFAADATFAWDVDFGNGVVVGDPKSRSNFVWCVRGGPGPDAQ